MRLSHTYEAVDLSQEQSPGQKASTASAMIKSQHLKEQALQKLFASPMQPSMKSSQIYSENMTPKNIPRLYDVLVDYAAIKPQLKNSMDKTIKAVSLQLQVSEGDPQTAERQLRESITKLCLPKYSNDVEFYNGLFSQLTDLVRAKAPSSQPRVQRKTAAEIESERLLGKFATHYDSFSQDKRFAPVSRLYDEQFETFRQSRAPKAEEPVTFSFQPQRGPPNPFPLAETSPARKLEIKESQLTDEQRYANERAKHEVHTDDITNKLAAKARQRELEATQKKLKELQAIAAQKASKKEETKDDSDGFKKVGEEAKPEELKESEPKQPEAPKEGEAAAPEGAKQEGEEKKEIEYKTDANGNVYLPTFEDLVRAQREVLRSEVKNNRKTMAQLREEQLRKKEEDELKKCYPIPQVTDQGKGMQFDVKEVSARLCLLAEMTKTKVAKISRDVQVKRDTNQLAIRVWNPKEKKVEKQPPQERFYTRETFDRMALDAKVRQVQQEMLQKQSAAGIVGPQCTFEPEINTQRVNALLQSRQERMMTSQMKKKEEEQRRLENGELPAEGTVEQSKLSLSQLNEKIPPQEIAFYDHLYEKGQEVLERREKLVELGESSNVIMANTIQTGRNSQRLVESSRQTFVRDLFQVLTHGEKQLTQALVNEAKPQFNKEIATDLEQLSKEIPYEGSYGISQFQVWFNSKPRPWAK